MNGALAALTVGAAAVWGLAHLPVRPPRAARRRLRREQRLAVRRPQTPDVNEVVTEVATRLRSGVAPAEAWAAAAERRGLPTSMRGDLPEALLALPGGAGTAGALAATRLAAELGAPLADMLDGCAAGILAAQEAEVARSLALAGPIASARLLAAMPLVGLCLGVLVGADPVGQLLGGGLGTAAGGAGVLAAGAGAAWSRALVRRARRAEDP